MRIRRLKRKPSSERAVSTTTARSTATASTGLAPVSRSVVDLFNDQIAGPDLRFLGPTSTCACGNTVFHALVWFDAETREFAGWFTEMKCVMCGAIVKGVTPVDEVIS